MTIQEYRQSLDQKSTAELRRMAKRAAQGTIFHVSGYTRIQLVHFIAARKYDA